MCMKRQQNQVIAKNQSLSITIQTSCLNEQEFIIINIYQDKVQITSLKQYLLQFHQMNLTYNDKDYEIQLPLPTVELTQIFNQLSIYSKECLDSDDNIEGPLSQQQIKGLKFIASKLAKLFSKNRRLPYNQISKILIDNFAHEQKDQRNIKRRVYDAINVLVSAGILVKKNNFIEMMKNKIKNKLDNDKKDKIEQEIREKQELLDQKRQRQTDLIHKHKLIRKLFDRNSKMINMKQNKLKKTRTRNDNLKGIQESRAIVSHKNSIDFEGFIYNPLAFILTSENINSKKVQKSLFKGSEESNQLQLIVPYKRHFYQPITMQSPQIPQRKREQNYMIQLEDQLEDDNFIPQNEDSQENVNRFISDYGIYYLQDLLELLSLNETLKGQQ